MVSINTFSMRINAGSSSQSKAWELDKTVNEYLRENNVSFSDIKRFDITTLEQHGTEINADKDVFLVYTLVVEKESSGNL